MASPLKYGEGKARTIRVGSFHKPRSGVPPGVRRPPTPPRAGREHHWGSQRMTWPALPGVVGGTQSPTPARQPEAEIAERQPWRVPAPASGLLLRRPDLTPPRTGTPPGRGFERV